MKHLEVAKRIKKLLEIGIDWELATSSEFKDYIIPEGAEFNNRVIDELNNLEPVSEWKFVKFVPIKMFVVDKIETPF